MPIKTPMGDEIYSYRKDHPEATWADTAKHFGLSKSTLKFRESFYRNENDIPPLGRRRRIKTKGVPEKTPAERISFTEKAHSAELYSVSKRIKTLEELIAASQADLSKWQVVRYTINVWEGGRKKKIVDLTWTNGVMDGYVEDTGEWQLTDFWQVKATFEPRKEEPYEKALEDLIERIKQHAPIYDPNLLAYAPLMDGYLAVINMYDAHLGKRPHRSVKHTLEDAKNEFIRIAGAIAAQLATSAKPISRILFPLGHDLLHVDNLFDKTSRGTWVETSEDIRLVIDAACEAIVRAVEILATVAPVDIVAVEGNHDRMQTYWIGKYAEAVFSNHPNVTVTPAKLERQYYQWGRMGLGLTHDGTKPQELTTLFPIEARYMWPDIEWTEWLTGHMHHQRGALYAVDSIRGTVVRTIPALCNMDNYHSLHLYVGVQRAAEVLYYHKENGPAGGFPVFVSELT